MGGLGILFIIVFYLAITILLLATAKPNMGKVTHSDNCTVIADSGCSVWTV